MGFVLPKKISLGGPG